MNKLEALDVISEYYDAPKDELEHVYDLTMHLYHKATRQYLIRALIEHYKRHIKLNQSMFNICNHSDFTIEKQKIETENIMLSEMINRLDNIDKTLISS